MRKSTQFKKTYLFRGKRVIATSKAEVLRAAGIPDTPRNNALVVRLKKGGL